jgi:biopolymer transport protein ExbD
MKFPRNARIFRGQLDASPFVGVLFLVAIFLLLSSSLVFLPGVPIRLPEASDLAGVTGPTVTVAVDTNRRLYFRNQVIREGELLIELRKAVRATKEPLTLVLMVDKTVPFDTFFGLAKLASEAGLKETLLATRPPAVPWGRKVAR